MGAANSLRNTDHAHPVAQAASGPAVQVGLQGNMGYQDVRGRLSTRVITVASFAAADEFKLRCVFSDGSTASTETIAFTDGTDAAASDIQTALRTATGDTGLTVAGTTDAGPYTVTSGRDPHRDEYELVAHDVVGCSVTITSGAVTYVDATGKPSTANTGASSPGESAGESVPLGYSHRTDGTGEDDGTILEPPTIDSAIGGNDEVVINATEVASGGTSAVVVYRVFKTDDDSIVNGATNEGEDADGDVTIAGLADATDYYLLGWTQTATGERVSRPSAPVYFTTT